MNDVMEVERKFELDPTGFEHLKNAAHVTRCIDQLNVYYDRKWKLADITATFRVRFSRGAAPVLTLKLPISEEQGVRRMQEFEYNLGSTHYVRAVAQQTEIDVDRELPPEVSERLLQLGLNRLQRIGWVRNRRYILAVEDIGELELDELRLPNGQRVYEAEIESADLNVQERLACWVRSIVPSASPSQVSKFQRFRAALTARNDDLDADGVGSCSER